MDYKYIEQLLERYWQCETTLEEENILKAFFSQKDVPAGLSQYRPLFAYEQGAMKDDVLGDDFDTKILAMTEGIQSDKKKARTITMRLMPLFKAAAVVAIVVTIGNAAQLSMATDKSDEDINYSSYKDTFTDPSVAYDKMENALQLMSEGISQAQVTDTLAPEAGIGVQADNEKTNKE